MAAVHIVVVPTRSGALSNEGAHMLDRRKRLHSAALIGRRHYGGGRQQSQDRADVRGLCIGKAEDGER